MQWTHFVLFNAIGALAQIPSETDFDSDEPSSTITAPPTLATDGSVNVATSLIISGFDTTERTFWATVLTADEDSTVLTYSCAPEQTSCDEAAPLLTIFGPTSYGVDVSTVDDDGTTTTWGVDCTAAATTVTCDNFWTEIADETTITESTSASSTSGTDLPVATFLIVAGEEQLGLEDPNSGEEGDDQDSTSTDDDNDDNTFGDITSTDDTDDETTSQTITSATTLTTTIASNGTTPRLGNPVSATTPTNGTTTPRSTTSATASTTSNAAPGALTVSGAGALGLIFAAALML